MTSGTADGPVAPTGFDAYLAEFKSLYGGVYGLLSGLPLIGSLLSEGNYRYALWPPLGAIEWLNAVAVVVALVPAVALWFIRSWRILRSPRRLRFATWTLVITLVLLVAYAALWNVVVFRLDSERCGGIQVGAPTEAWVSIGFWRSGKLSQSYAGASDRYALCTHGHSEDALHDIWGTGSLFFARIVLLLALCAVMFSATVVIALFPLFRYVEKNPQDKT